MCFFRPIFFLKKLKFENFLLEKFPIFPILNVPQYVFKTLLWGPKSIRKKYWVVFEIFLKRMLKAKYWKAGPYRALKIVDQKTVTKFFYWKDFRFFFLKLCLHNSSKRTKNNQKKTLSSFWEIWEKLEKNFAKKGIFDFGKIFWKKEHSDFFLRIFQKTCLTII